jgi:HSP20 family protein
VEMKDRIEPKKKQELEKKEADIKKVEHTYQGKYYRPLADIFENQDGITIELEMPGVTKEHVEINYEEGNLYIDGKIDLKKYDGLSPIYTEYNVGHFVRSFSLSKDLDVDNIKASVADGVLILIIPRAPEKKPRKIELK